MTADGSAEHSEDTVQPPDAPREATGARDATGVVIGSGIDFDQLYRDHVDDARRLARILVGAEQAEELVAESFARVLAQLRAGRGPRDNFRAYLHVTIRNGFRDSLRAPRESPVSDQPWLFDDVQPSVEELVEDLEADTAAHAFATLPESWQKVLWHVEVEGRKPGEVADLLGMRAGAVSSLAHRAREGLRRAYLDQHVVTDAAASECAWTRVRLSQYVRSDLSARAEEKVAAHIGGCEECLAAYLQVDRVNRKLAAWLFPVVLLGALPASGKGLAWLVGVTGVGAAGTSGTGGPGSAGGASSSGTTGTVAVAAAAALAAGIAGLTWVMTSDDAEPAAAG
ncbi:MAG TPA: sigma-70 family RNA polymerase sigma factor, partial [Nocardioides sp.]|nr:sigma-70 family RNA polymerase sigma factor [Nocardioides sp.]